MRVSVFACVSLCLYKFPNLPPGGHDNHVPAGELEERVCKEELQGGGARSTQGRPQ